MNHTDTLIVGGGQAGLALSRSLTDLAIDHVVLERGRVAERWRSERWDSLRLLTPNWQSRLPGFSYDGADPDGFMTAREVVGYFERYAHSFSAPVVQETTVVAVSPTASGFRVATDQGDWCARAVVVATGDADLPAVPAMATGLPGDVAQVLPTEYRHPGQLPAGGVLVVGASATGVQLADELQRAGRDVTVAVGHHTRLPRRYRGRDIMWWLDRAGVLDERANQVYDLEISRRQPSLQLVGRTDHSSLSLRELRAAGVRIVGRLKGVDDMRLSVADDLVATTAASDAKLAMLLHRLDQFATAAGLDAEVDAPEPFEPIWPAFVETPSEIDLRATGITTVVWASGYRRRYPWLRVPVLDRRGEIIHDGGVTRHPGLYVIGLRFLRRRNSSFIDGVGKDARELAEHIAGQLGARERAIA